MADLDRLPSGKWQARWRDNTGRQCKRSFNRKLDAQRFLTGIRADLDRGTYRDDRRGKTPLKEYAEAWRLRQAHRPTTMAQVEAHLRNHVYPTFGHRPINSIRQDEVQAWVKGLEEALAPATVELVYSFLATILRSAIINRDLVETPCVSIRLPEVTPKRVEPLATDRVVRLIEEIPERYRALVVLAAGTGLRQGEAFGLTVDRVHFLKRELVVDRQLIQPRGGPPTFGPPKTKTSYRTIPLPNVVLEALSSHLERFPAEPTGFVFTTPAGLPLRRTRWGEVWRPACRRAGLPDSITFHDLRHYYASLLIHHNESVKVVQARLGHKDAKETLNIYAHLWPASEEATRAAVDSVLGAERREAQAQ